MQIDYLHLIANSSITIYFKFGTTAITTPFNFALSFELTTLDIWIKQLWTTFLFIWNIENLIKVNHFEIRMCFFFIWFYCQYIFYQLSPVFECLQSIGMKFYDYIMRMHLHTLRWLNNCWAFFLSHFLTSFLGEVIVFDF